MREQSILNTATYLKVMLKFFLRIVELLVCLTADYRLSGGKVGKGSCDLLKAVFGNSVLWWLSFLNRCCIY